MSDISALKMFSTDSVQRLMERARLNQEDDDSVDSKMSRIKAFLYFMLHTPIVSLDLQCDSYYLQEMFTLVLFVLIQQHEYGVDFQKIAQENDVLNNCKSKDATVITSFSQQFLSHYIVFLAQILQQCTPGHFFRGSVYSSHFCEIYFSFCRRLSHNQNDLDTYIRVQKNLLLERRLMNELKPQSDTKRVQDHHTNRINIVNQISQDRLKEIEKLSRIVAKALQGSTLKDVSEIGQIYEFWENFQKSVTEEFSMKQTKTVLLVNERNITVPCRCIRYTKNPKEAMKEFQEIYNENHSRINSQMSQGGSQKK
ncbi:Conserved_hypothetical protein [Hexamita inflata]|uniref:Uncharacterized protein n=1 Tax=Hexamita inflata TaxID=28002 RepID=A0AA86V2G8_9EUKA|nr:Conserved hypothetical protein [Hexamita inflata]